MNHWFACQHLILREIKVLELRYELLMELPYEYETENSTTSEREWIVEYEVESGDSLKQQHLTILNGWNIQEVQIELFKELRKLYPASERLDVTITRLEPVSTQTDTGKFDLDSTYTA